MKNIFQQSINIILENQAPSGAYPACPNYPTYHYGWFRDSSFIAYAMDLVGQHDSASRFHDWAAKCINDRAQIIKKVIKDGDGCESHQYDNYLHARYNLDGSDVSDNTWPNFQLDGFGSWLWALGEHLQITGIPLQTGWVMAADLIAEYLTALWMHPCYDCWEENPDKVHPYTLSAIFGGLQAHSEMTGCDHTSILKTIRQFVFEKFVINGHFIKQSRLNAVDASLLGISTPYNLVSPEHLLMSATVDKIESDLYTGGGVHRYAADTFYGGGEWLLLAGWLGWYYARIGENKRVYKLLCWIEEQTDEMGNMPEQVDTYLLFPEHLNEWESRWGKVAKPLLWSHAMYLVLYHQYKSSDAFLR